ncbi:hypothetical protein WR25_15912 isoform A [Diploscapter pachys]|uniref:Phorbol-ester/DAG-type domain-containing protein n=1 Tax=Diploscapter pachys TaxID=2018661 RepID=A0A2A2J2I9_9BILA|nr:hypothetical protein WR25_15912 isoform A [Diploscapter pachys]
MFISATAAGESRSDKDKDKERGNLNGNGQGSATMPNIVKADGHPTYGSYSVLGRSNSQSAAGNSSPATKSWLAGLKERISQISSFSEWLNQLGGIVDTKEQRREDKRRSNQLNANEMPSPTSPDGTLKDPTLKYRNLVLSNENHPSDAAEEDEPLDLWDFNASLLADLDSSHAWNDTLEKQHFGPLRDLLIVGGSHKAGKHEFKEINLLHPTWCDKCGDFIWGLLKQAIRCDKCSFTCHERCRELVTVECRGSSTDVSMTDIPSIYPPLPADSLGTIPRHIQMTISESSPLLENLTSKTATSSSGPYHTLPKEVMGNLKEELPRRFTQTLNVKEYYAKEVDAKQWKAPEEMSELRQRIEQYNSHSTVMPITLHEDGQTYSGQLAVHLNLCRPISVVAGAQHPHVYDITATDKTQTNSSLRTISSFFLPRNTVRNVNLHSNMTARQMIGALLKKFRVADNPRKFAMYECSQEADENSSTLFRKFTRIPDDVCPLNVALSWQNPLQHSFVLQENDTGGIVWEAFEVPELENFLRILKMEENQYIYQTKQRYTEYERYLDAELRLRGHEPSKKIIKSDSRQSTDDNEVEEDPVYVNIPIKKPTKV